jgi:hypothetical protein
MNNNSTPYLVRVGSVSLDDPKWFDQYRDGRHEAMVSRSNGRPELTVGDYTFGIAACDLADGTPILFWYERTGYFYCDTAGAIEARVAAQKAAEQAKEEALRIKHNAMRDAANRFNAKFKLPVAWQLAQKDVLSGLSEAAIATGRADGRKGNSVNHIRLKEPLSAGRLKRDAGDLLCTSASGSNGAEYSGPNFTPMLYDGDGKVYTPPVTCTACIKAAKRWITEA